MAWHSGVRESQESEEWGGEMKKSQEKHHLLQEVGARHAKSRDCRHTALHIASLLQICLVRPALGCIVLWGV